MALTIDFNGAAFSGYALLQIRPSVWLHRFRIIQTYVPTNVRVKQCVNGSSLSDACFLYGSFFVNLYTQLAFCNDSEKCYLYHPFAMWLCQKIRPGTLYAAAAQPLPQSQHGTWAEPAYF